MDLKEIKAGMPPVGVPLIVTVEDFLKGEREVRYPVYYQQSPFSNSLHFRWKYGDLDYELLQDVRKVVAWAKIPEPYVDDEEMFGML